MISMRTTFAALALVACCLNNVASAFVTPASSVLRSSSAPISPLFMSDDREGGAAIAKPKIQTKTTTVTKQKQKQKQRQRQRTSDPINRRDEEFEDAPMYRLMLLGDEEYDVVHVVERMCAILDDMDEDAASTILNQAQIAGKAMCGKYPFEHAEMYKEQLARSDPMIYSDLEEENKRD